MALAGGIKETVVQMDAGKGDRWGYSRVMLL